jgi:hypothetical protein
MLYTQSYQMYKCEHGLTTAAEQRAADVRAGEAAAALAAVLGDLDEAIEVARAHPMARQGILEVRPFRALGED